MFSPFTPLVLYKMDCHLQEYVCLCGIHSHCGGLTLLTILISVPLLSVCKSEMV
jgi:hypothetical protein